MNMAAALNSLPELWRSVRFKWLLNSLESGRREVSDTETFEGGALSIGGEHIGWKGEWLLDNPRFVSFEFFDKLSSGKIQLGDVLMVKDGATIGKVAIAEKLPSSNAAVNEHVFLFRLKLENHPKFYFYYMQSALAQNQIYLEIRGAAQPGLNSEFRNIVLAPQPPLAEQLRIADFLNDEVAQIDALVIEKERMLGLLAEKRAALITRAVTRGFNPDIPLQRSGIPWIGYIPSHWEVRRSKYLFKQASLPVEEGDEIVTCFRDGQVTLRKNRREEGFTNAVLELGYQGIRSGQLVLHSMDAFAGAIGVSDSDGKCSPEYIICDPIDSEVISDYYAKLLRIMALRGYILAACPAVRERAPRIRFSHFANMLLLVPPRTEQEQIVAAIVQEREQTIEMEATLSKSIELLKERRSALITSAVTGQIEPEAMNP